MGIKNIYTTEEKIILLKEIDIIWCFTRSFHFFACFACCLLFISIVHTYTYHRFVVRYTQHDIQIYSLFSHANKSRAEVVILNFHDDVDDLTLIHVHVEFTHTSLWMFTLFQCGGLRRYYVTFGILSLTLENIRKSYFPQTRNFNWSEFYTKSFILRCDVSFTILHEFKAFSGKYQRKAVMCTFFRGFSLNSHKGKLKLSKVVEQKWFPLWRMYSK